MKKNVWELHAQRRGSIIMQSPIFLHTPAEQLPITGKLQPIHIYVRFSQNGAVIQQRPIKVAIHCSCSTIEYRYPIAMISDHTRQFAWYTPVVTIVHHNALHNCEGRNKFVENWSQSIVLPSVPANWINKINIHWRVDIPESIRCCLGSAKMIFLG